MNGIVGYHGFHFFNVRSLEEVKKAEVEKEESGAEAEEGAQAEPGVEGGLKWVGGSGSEILLQQCLLGYWMRFLGPVGLIS